MCGLIWLTDLKSKIDSIDLLTMLTSAVCHDLDHTGYNNAYQLIMIMKKVSDFNETRPMDVAEPWLDCLLQEEFYNQSDMEKLEGLPVTPYRDKVTKAILSDKLHWLCPITFSWSWPTSSPDWR
ncbi:high affinity cGMP-specific 3',5'-cyclic phosphodiesterase 9A-like [Salvelinus sp. IW2-2015]|uniref:high affinity cGMP-specific 3',5'-cyclic phosphodiesterase 9A-like n=1 Tax=Salvelinus sp. IW2-2015 TaxID=2691554 RepID=UPI0038D4B9AA